MNLQDFDRVYSETYDTTLKYVVIHCNHIDNINEIIQDIYVELYRKLNKQSIDVQNESAYIIGIAKNIIKRYYHLKKKTDILLDSEESPKEISDDFDLEQDFITRENAQTVWKMICQKDLITTKIFYLYFILGYKIEEVAMELQLNVSMTKSRIYRTLREIKNKLKKEGEE